MKYSNMPINLDGFAAINATRAAANVSSRYAFIPTTTALAVLADHGWHPVAASQARVVKPEKSGFQYHAVRLQNSAMTHDLKVGSTIPQISLRNSHSATSAFVLDTALLELRCLNGMVADLGGKEQARILHRNFDAAVFETMLRELVANFGDVMTSVDAWRAKRLTEIERRAYAEAAIELRFDGDKYAVEPETLLIATRSSEIEPTIWNTFNVVQEKLLKGGVSQARRDGSKIKSREVKDIREDTRLNKALWKLTDLLARSVS